MRGLIFLPLSPTMQPASAHIVIQGAGSATCIGRGGSGGPSGTCFRIVRTGRTFRPAHKRQTRDKELERRSLLRESAPETGERASERANANETWELLAKILSGANFPIAASQPDRLSS